MLKKTFQVFFSHKDNLVMRRYQSFVTVSHAKEEEIRKLIQRFILSRGIL